MVFLSILYGTKVVTITFGSAGSDEGITVFSTLDGNKLMYLTFTGSAEGYNY